MKVRRSVLCAAMTLSLLCVGASQLYAQALIASETSAAGSAATDIDVTSGAILGGDPGATAEPAPADPKSSTAAQQDPDRLKVVIYPILAWAPIFGASVRVPDTPSTPGGGTATTNTSLNGAAMFGFTIQKAKWYGDWNGMYAGMNASRTSPHVNLDVTGFFSGAQVGYKVYRDFYFTGGFRHMGIDYSVTLGDFPAFKRSPGVWDPLLGVLWQKEVTKKWTLKANLQGGGFGVGSDVDFSAVGSADWQFAKHFGLTMGYGVIHFDITDTKFNQTFKINQTLNGPQFGFGIYF